jgi:hypothetical protein
MMPRTVLVADLDDRVGGRITRIAHQAGYHVLRARSAREAAAALAGCPISGVVIGENLLRDCDIGRLVVRAPVLVLSDGAEATVARDLASLSKVAPDAEVQAALVAIAGDPRCPGRREIVPIETTPPPLAEAGRSRI